MGLFTRRPDPLRAEKRELSRLHGRDGALHRRIASGYARGDYMAAQRREQNDIRGRIRVLTAFIKENEQ